MTNEDAAENAIEVLNRIHKTDPSVLQHLIGLRVVCNDALADDPTVQVGQESGHNVVGILGIINGLFGIDNRGVGRIGAVYLAGKLQYFIKVDSTDFWEALNEHI